MMGYVDFMAWMKNDNHPFWLEIVSLSDPTSWLAGRELSRVLEELGIEVSGKKLVVACLIKGKKKSMPTGSNDYTKLREYLMNHPLYQIHKI